MGKADGKSRSEVLGLDLEHELPEGERDERTEVGGPLSDAVTQVSSPLEAELQKVRAERDTLVDRLARMQAEFENARRRASKEQQEFKDYAIVDAIRSLLPAMDSFERALRVKSEPADFRNGVELIYRQIQDALAKLGVSAIPAKGEQFDPRVHEAIEMVETGQVPDHEVIEELQRGYKVKDRLLRPAMVKVAKNPA
ncbi:MAG TPA: nucleotide exchange factor GrpE [Candidatus Sulfotelmatobacter sp.]